MKYLKTKNISKFSIKDNTLIVNPYGRINIDSTNSLMLPKGTTAQRPDELTIPNLQGALRYNNETYQIEAYIGSPGNETWETVAAPGLTSITKQTLGPGDDVETIFGPLSVVPPNKNTVFVLVENVLQISDTNYDILYDYLVSGDAYIEFTSPVPLDKDITILYGFAN